MASKPILALVVSRAGPLLDGLLALMTTIPQISAVLVADDVSSALRMVDNHQPALIILDISLSRVQSVKEIKTLWPHRQLIVIVEEIAQQKEAEASGVDNVLLEGFPAQKLIAIVEELIDRREETPPVQADTEGGNEY